ncbi:unnamed protein product, partial [Rotaria sordida]
TCIYALVNVFGKPIRINNVDGTTFPNLICSQNVNLNHTQDDNYLSIDVILEDGITAFGHFLPSSNMIDNSMDIDDNNCLIRAVMGDDISAADAQNSCEKRLLMKSRTIHK